MNEASPVDELVDQLIELGVGEHLIGSRADASVEEPMLVSGARSRTRGRWAAIAT